MRNITRIKLNDIDFMIDWDSVIFIERKDMFCLVNIFFVNNQTHHVRCSDTAMLDILFEKMVSDFNNSKRISR